MYQIVGIVLIIFIYIAIIYDIYFPTDIEANLSKIHENLENIEAALNSLDERETAISIDIRSNIECPGDCSHCLYKTFDSEDAHEFICDKYGVVVD